MSDRPPNPALGAAPQEAPAPVTLRPSWVYVVQAAQGPLLLGLAVALIGVLLRVFVLPPTARIVREVGGLSLIPLLLMLLGAGFALSGVLGAMVRWRFVRYTLLPDRLVTRAGVFARSVRDVPWANMQHAVLRQSVLERLAGAGTLALASAGTDAFAATLASVPRPARVLEQVRSRMDQAKGPRPHPPHADASRRTAPASAPGRPFVLGLVGAIGAGKSEAARILARLGWAVIDADALAKEALQRPDVKRELVHWWGPEVLSAEGTVDRAQVARIVFADPQQRARLEALTHPIVLAQRARVIEQAARENRPGVVVDAPLLFEAGSDRDCDAVLCIDAPRQVRVQRVAGRGWSEAELARREAAQIPIDEKRRRSRFVIDNAGTLAAYQEQVRAVAREIAP